MRTGKPYVLLDGAPLCEVTENGGAACQNEDTNMPKRIAAKDQVYGIVRTTAEYMRQMKTGSFLNADGPKDGYKVLADFSGTVLAGIQSKYSILFVTWDWGYGHTGVCHGHYFMENYEGTKQGLSVRSGLIQKTPLFTPEQISKIYCCCADFVDGDFFELTGEQEKNDPQCSAEESVIIVILSGEASCNLDKRMVFCYHMTEKINPVINLSSAHSGI